MRIRCGFIALLFLIAPVVAQGPRVISLITGRGELLTFERDIERLAISEPKIADAVLVSPREIMINGPGQIFIERKGRLELTDAKFPTKEALAAAMPNWEPTHLFKRILPRMKERGVTDEAVRTIFVDNPRRYFRGEESPREPTSG